MGGGDKLDVLIGQCLMVAPPGDWATASDAWLDDLQPAGTILFVRNLPHEHEAAQAAIARLHAWGARRGRAFLVAMDEEGGFVTQTAAWFPTPPSARALAWGGPPAKTERAYTTYGWRLRGLGVNVDFAPVCDVNNNPANPVIGVRSFGSEPETVAQYARAVHAGLNAAGLASCAKHFPGHGDTDVDSHLSLPVVDHDRARFERVEWVPFRAVLASVPLVMVAHLACKNLGGGALPATLVAGIATGLLRRELGFTGVAVTDAMDMQGVAGAFGVGEAAVRALLAGCDLLLYCFEIDKPLAAREALRSAVESGRLPMARLEEAAGRVAHLGEQVAALAAARPLVAPLPAPQDDAAQYRALCRDAVRIENSTQWQDFTAALRVQRSLALAGWSHDTMARLQARLATHGVAVQRFDLDKEAPDERAPLLVLLGERRPLGPERIAGLRQLASRSGPVALANLLTPEIDAPVAASFTAILRSADASDAMLDEIATRLVG